jgi:hypothetical protein
MNTFSKTRSAPMASIIALFTLLFVTPFSFAASDAVSTMSGTVSGMNHFPSAEQKETLAAISGNENNSEATRAIADAIHDIEHKAKPDDVAALKKVTGDSSATEAEKQLSAIVLEFHHKAGADARKTLERLAQ